MPDDDEEPDEKYTTQFNKLFHKAMGEREGRIEKNLAKKFEGMLAGKFDELRTLLASTDADTDDDVDATVDVDAGGEARISPDVRAKMLRMDRENKEFRESSMRFQQQYEAERARGQRAEERQALSSVLGPFVKPKMLDIAVDQLHARNLMRDEETGTILWKSDDGTTLPLKDGVASWAKSDVGKEFAPPVEARGRGGRGPEGANGIQPGKMTVEDLGSVITGSIPGQRGG
jgi:hypothetical protein